MVLQAGNLKLSSCLSKVIAHIVESGLKRPASLEPNNMGSKLTFDGLEIFLFIVLADLGHSFGSLDL